MGPSLRGSDKQGLLYPNFEKYILFCAEYDFVTFFLSELIKVVTIPKIVAENLYCHFPYTGTLRISNLVKKKSRIAEIVIILNE